MSVWDSYRNRVETHGGSVRGAAKKQEIRMLTNKLRENLSYFTITVFDQAHGFNIDSEPNKNGSFNQDVAIINSDNLNEKYIYSLPGEDIEHGCLVRWMDNYWLVTERDANTNVYARAKMIQCNYLLKWVSDNTIYEQWCIVEDGTKLRRTLVRDSLVYRKQYAKRTPLIAGNSLEPYSLQRGLEKKTSANAKKNTDWTISSQALNRGRFNDYPGRGSRCERIEMGSPKPLNVAR